MSGLLWPFTLPSLPIPQPGIRDGITFLKAGSFKSLRSLFTLNFYSLFSQSNLLSALSTPYTAFDAEDTKLKRLHARLHGALTWCQESQAHWQLQYHAIDVAMGALKSECPDYLKGFWWRLEE